MLNNQVSSSSSPYTASRGSKINIQHLLCSLGPLIHPPSSLEPIQISHLSGHYPHTLAASLNAESPHGEGVLGFHLGQFPLLPILQHILGCE